MYGSCYSPTSAFVWKFAASSNLLIPALLLVFCRQIFTDQWPGFKLIVKAYHLAHINNRYYFYIAKMQHTFFAYYKEMRLLIFHQSMKCFLFQLFNLLRHDPAAQCVHKTHLLPSLQTWCCLLTLRQSDVQRMEWWRQPEKATELILDVLGTSSGEWSCLSLRLVLEVKFEPQNDATCKQVVLEHPLFFKNFLGASLAFETQSSRGRHSCSWNSLL